MTRDRGGRRILLFVYWLGQGGMEQHTLHLARAFAARGDQVTIGYVERVGDDDGLADEPFRIVDLHVPNPLHRYTSVRRLCGLARQADVIHCTGWDASAWGRLAAGAVRRPVIVTEHSSATRTTQRYLGRFPIGRLVGLHNRLLDPVTYAMVAVAESQVEQLRREGVAKHKIAVIPNGVELEGIRAAAGKGLTREELGIPEEAKVVVQVGRFIVQKRQEWSYEAVRALRRELGDVRLVLVGDGPERPALERRARAEGAEWVNFLGQRPDVARLLRLSDLAVLPSTAEALPMAMLEALAVGVPQVATDVGDVGRVLRDSGAGLVVEPHDHGAFTEACRVVLVDHARAEAMRTAAGAAAEAFTLERMIAGYEELFDGAVAARRRPRSAPRGRVRVRQ